MKKLLLVSTLLIAHQAYSMEWLFGGFSPSKGSSQSNSFDEEKKDSVDRQFEAQQQKKQVKSWKSAFLAPFHFSNKAIIGLSTFSNEASRGLNFQEDNIGGDSSEASTVKQEIEKSILEKKIETYNDRLLWLNLPGSHFFGKYEKIVYFDQYLKKIVQLDYLSDVNQQIIDAMQEIKPTEIQNPIKIKFEEQQKLHMTITNICQELGKLENNEESHKNVQQVCKNLFEENNINLDSPLATYFNFAYILLTANDPKELFLQEYATPIQQKWGEKSIEEYEKDMEKEDECIKDKTDANRVKTIRFLVNQYKPAIQNKRELQAVEGGTLTGLYQDKTQNKEHLNLTLQIIKTAKKGTHLPKYIEAITTIENTFTNKYLTDK